MGAGDLGSISDSEVECEVGCEFVLGGSTEGVGTVDVAAGTVGWSGKEGPGNEGPGKDGGGGSGGGWADDAARAPNRL